jgi:hypothetical protein
MTRSEPQWHCPVRSISPSQVIRAFLIAFSREELHHLLDVELHQVNAQHLTRVRPHADDDIDAADAIDDEKTTVVAAKRNPPSCNLAYVGTPTGVRLGGLVVSSGGR